MTFEEYLVSKKIDSKVFREQEENLWKNWEQEFAQMHPASFTSQKLYLINPIRRKYPLPVTAEKPVVIEAPIEKTESAIDSTEVTTPKPVAAKHKPVFKPKIN